MTIRILSSKAPAPLLARLVTELGGKQKWTEVITNTFSLKEF